MEQMAKKGPQVGISLFPGQLGFVKTPVSEAPGGQFLLGQALLKRTWCSGVTFPLLLPEALEKFSSIFTVRTWKNPWRQNSTKAWRPLMTRVTWDSQICLYWACNWNCKLQFRLFCLTRFRWRCLLIGISSELWLRIWLSNLWCCGLPCDLTSLLDLRITDFSGFLAFYLLGWSGNF